MERSRRFPIGALENRVTPWIEAWIGRTQKKRREAFVMNAVEIHDHARKLYDVQGAKALAEAAQMVRRYEKTGDERTADDWRRIELALRQLLGPRVS